MADSWTARTVTSSRTSLTPNAALRAAARHEPRFSRYKRKYEKLIEPTMTKSAMFSDVDVDDDADASNIELGVRSAEPAAAGEQI